MEKYPSNWPAGCQANDAVDADGNPNGLFDEATDKKQLKGVLVMVM